MDVLKLHKLFPTTFFRIVVERLGNEIGEFEEFESSLTTCVAVKICKFGSTVTLLDLDAEESN